MMGTTLPSASLTQVVRDGAAPDRVCRAIMSQNLPYSVRPGALALRFDLISVQKYRSGTWRSCSCAPETECVFWRPSSLELRVSRISGNSSRFSAPATPAYVFGCSASSNSAST